MDITDKLTTITGEKRWAMVCYIPVFNIVTCVLTAVKMVNSKFCLFHARQGLVLFGLWFLTIVVAVISPIVSLMLWGIVLLLHGSGMVIAFNMKETAIPIIGQFAAKIPENYIFSFLTHKKVDKVPDVKMAEPLTPQSTSTAPVNPSEPPKSN